MAGTISPYVRGSQPNIPGNARLFIDTELAKLERTLKEITTAINALNTTRTVAPSVAAAGTTQGTATALTADINIVATATPGSATGVILPASSPAKVVVVINTTAHTISIYPASGGTIDSLATNAAFSLGSGAKLQFAAGETEKWYSLTAVYG